MPPFDDFSQLEDLSIKLHTPSLLNRIIASSINLHLIKYGYIPTGKELAKSLSAKKLNLNLAQLTAICDKYRYLSAIN